MLCVLLLQLACQTDNRLVLLVFIVDRVLKKNISGNYCRMGTTGKVAGDCKYSVFMWFSCIRHFCRDNKQERQAWWKIVENRTIMNGIKDERESTYRLRRGRVRIAHENDPSKVFNDYWWAMPTLRTFLFFATDKWLNQKH